MLTIDLNKLPPTVQNQYRSLFLHGEDFKVLSLADHGSRYQVCLTFNAYTKVWSAHTTRISNVSWCEDLELCAGCGGRHGPIPWEDTNDRV